MFGVGDQYDEIDGTVLYRNKILHDNYGMFYKSYASDSELIKIHFIQ